MIIREATIQDLSQLLPMGKQFHEYAGFSQYNLRWDEESAAKTFHSLIRSDKSMISVADKDGTLLGMIAGSLSEWFLCLSQAVAAEHWWWVRPEARNVITVHRRLMNTFEVWARNRGAVVISMAGMAASNHDKLKKYYKRLGYDLLETHYMRRA